MRLTLWSCHSNGANASDTDRAFLISSGSKSQMVLPSSIRPRRVVAPDRKASASAREVFPVPWWPKRPTLRIASGGYVFIRQGFYLHTAAPPAPLLAPLASREIFL